MQKIVVLIPFRNVGGYIVDCVNSLLNQEYINYEAYLLDDQSDDGTLDLITEEFDHIHKIRNETRLGPMGNIFRALKELSFDEEDIIVLLDGDDYIFGEFAFQILNDKYQKGTLLTHGQYITNYGVVGNCSAYSEEEFRQLRNAPWKASHLKTFKYKLFKTLLKADPQGKNFKYKDGSFFKASSDMGIMIPLMEIAGYHNVEFISNVVYCYRLHSQNDHASARGRQLQLEAENYIRRQLPPLERLF
ncbi:glycosyltransferase family 2 protein [Fulvivirgaceae bacterium BMA12]|uniref:Glycosyltransferase family 2 protein n=1 Tax=Agaribacillus aureus TaxID=3051825 RepID=A0ABT8L7J5_9BACT|nr:glycosyltransferase family 2 protein [Fulvivirgaceae bacterium BMA12]